MVAHRLPKPGVAGSSPVSRSTAYMGYRDITVPFSFIVDAEKMHSRPH